MSPLPPPGDLRSDSIRALLTVLFEHDLSTHLVLDPTRLAEHGGHGFPANVVSVPPNKVGILLNLEARHYRQMKIHLGPTLLTCILSFDRLREVEIPYDAICAVTQAFPLELREGAPAPVLELVPAPILRPALRLVSDDEG